MLKVEHGTGSAPADCTEGVRSLMLFIQLLIVVETLLSFLQQTGKQPGILVQAGSETGRCLIGNKK